jgi:hypothetical protein
MDEIERKEADLDQLYVLAESGNAFAQTAYLAIAEPKKWKIPGSMRQEVLDYLKSNQLESLYQVLEDRETNEKSE